MGKSKSEEALQKKRERDRRRREKIKNDPELYRKFREKERARYQKRKQEKKALPISGLPPQKQKILRQRNREGFRAYYQRLKAKKLETIVEVESEPEITLPELNEQSHKKNDPLTSSPAPETSRYSLRSGRHGTRQSDCTKTNYSTDTRGSPNISDSNISNEPLLSESPLVFKNCLEITSSTPLPTSSTPIEAFGNLEKYTDNFTSENELANVRSATSTPTSCSRTSISRVNSNSSVSTCYSESSKPKITPKKKKTSPSRLLLRRYRRKTNKEINHLNKKIRDLKNINYKYKKQIYRLSQKANAINRNKDEKNIKDTESDQRVLAKSKIEKIRKDVELFLENDENSRMCPGKREFITKNKIKKQKRYLTESMLNLHKKFVASNAYAISYSFFCKLQPFWVIVPDFKARETCLCKIHANMDLIITCLKRFNVINESDSHKVLSSLCCDPNKVDCLSRECEVCATRTMNWKETNDEEQIYYWHWISKKVSYSGKDGKEKSAIQTVKEKITAFPKDAIKQFDKMLRPYMQHCANKITQSNYINHLKYNLPENDCIVQIDFSENYNTKYTNEIQSFHFGGSRKQITLHTVVIYYIKEGNLCHRCFCTLSESLRHDAVAVWAHLLPVLQFIETEAPQVNGIHFISDSPTGQYRNRKMFFIMSKLHLDLANLQFVGWNYTESGHGKSAADGVGATLKRTADKIVAQGNDIVDVESLVKHLRINVPGIVTHIINESDILEKDLMMPANLREFAGTMKVHQVVWNLNNPYVLSMRKLSCLAQECIYQSIECKHGKHIGFLFLDDRQQVIKQSSPKTDLFRDPISSGSFNKPSSGSTQTIKQSNPKLDPFRDPIPSCSFDKPSSGSKQTIKKSNPKIDPFRDPIPSCSFDKPSSGSKQTIKQSNPKIDPFRDPIPSCSFDKPSSGISLKKSDSEKPKIISNILLKPGKDSKKSSKIISSRNNKVRKNNHADVSELSELIIPETDSFWAPVSSVDCSLEMPSSGINVEQCISKNGNEELESDDSDYDIFSIVKTKDKK